MLKTNHPYLSTHNQIFWHLFVKLYSVGTHHENLLRSLAAMCKVTHFIPRIHTGRETALAETNEVKTHWERLEKFSVLFFK